VDLVALADDGDVPRLLSLGHEHGFEPRVADAIAFAKVSRVLLLKHEPSGIEIDLSLAGLPFEREVIERAVERSMLELAAQSADSSASVRAAALLTELRNR